jgi:nitroreductase
LTGKPENAILFPVEVQEAILERRSVRQFSDRPVEARILREALQAAIWAPTAANAQPWALICVTDPEAVRRIRAVSPGIFWDPQAVVCVCSDQRKAGRFKAGPVLARFDCAMAAQNLMLRAFSLGLGSCVIRSANLEAVRLLLQAPEHIQPELLIILGYPAGRPQAPPRDPGVIHWQKYGNREADDGRT